MIALMPVMRTASRPSHPASVKCLIMACRICNLTAPSNTEASLRYQPELWGSGIRRLTCIIGDYCRCMFFSAGCYARTRRRTIYPILVDHENVNQNTGPRTLTYQLSESLRRHCKQDTAFVLSPHCRIRATLAKFTLNRELNCGITGHNR